MPIHSQHAVEPESDDGSLCKEAILSLCGLGDFVWRDVSKSFTNNFELKVHGLKDKASNRAFKEGSIEKERLLDHFYTLEGLAEDTATRLVRHKTGLPTLRDHNDQNRYLP